jgi:hypothetical protein
MRICNLAFSRSCLRLQVQLTNTSRSKVLRADTNVDIDHARRRYQSNSRTEAIAVPKRVSRADPLGPGIRPSKSTQPINAPFRLVSESDTFQSSSNKFLPGRVITTMDTSRSEQKVPFRTSAEHGPNVGMQAPNTAPNVGMVLDLVDYQILVRMQARPKEAQIRTNVPPWANRVPHIHCDCPAK